MTQPRSSLHHPKIHRRAIYAGAALRKSAATAAMAGRAAYREEFQPDHGPISMSPWTGRKRDGN